MSGNCPSCNSTCLTEEDYGGQKQCVCTDCGEVIHSVASYVQDKDYFSSVTSCHAGGSYQSANLGPGRTFNSNTSVNLLIWLTYLRQVCGMMKLTPEMQRAAVKLFTDAYKLACLKYKQTPKKLALCGACVLVICRRENWPVIITDILCVVQTSKSAMHEMIKTLKHAFGEDIPTCVGTSSCDNIVSAILTRYNIVGADRNERTIKLIHLARETWITCGRSYDAVVLAAAYIVWKVSKKKNARLGDFGKEFRLKVPKHTKLRVEEIKKVLLQLVVKLPWLSSSQKADPNVAIQHLTDILKYKRSLLSGLKVPQEKDEESTTETETVSEMDLPSCAAFLPPSVTNPKVNRKRKFWNYEMDPTSPSKMSSTWNNEEVSLDEELTEQDIPEEEMCLYIRTTAEVAQLEGLQESKE